MANALSMTLPNDTTIVLNRTFEARKSAVWQTLTEASYVRKWLMAPPGWSMRVCEESNVVGGSFKYTWVHSSGSKIEITGKYREITLGEKRCRTEERILDGNPESHGTISTMVIQEFGGKTMLSLTLEYDSQKSRDAAIQAGIERGMTMNYNSLEEFLASGS